MLLAANPFVNAYLQSDWFGKGIFWGLFLLSLISWCLLLFKTWQIVQIRRLSADFERQFSASKEMPLDFQCSAAPKHLWAEVPHPFFEVYKTAKHNALQLLNRNHTNDPEKTVALTPADLELIESQTGAVAQFQCKSLEKNLFILSTVVTLGPFLGLLGTVWGILLTFNQMPNGFSASNAAMLSGLSMALATTVIGLVVAIPAIIGYNYLKNASREYKRELEHFAHLLLGAVELQYRRDS